MSHYSLLVLLINRQAFSLLLIFAFLTVLPIHEKTASANTETTSLEPTTEEVTFTNNEDVLAGTLYLPGEKPCPAVVLITGSNRGPRGPLLTRIAEHFVQHGVAALHYDSPGTGKSTGNTILQSREDRADEAISAIRFLRTQQSIDPNHVGLWGGSEGASIVLLAAATYPQEVSFVIPVSGGVGVGGGSIFENMNHAAECFAVDNNLGIDEMYKIVTFEQLTYVFLTRLNMLEWHLIERRAVRWPDEPWAEFIEICQMQTRFGSLTAEDKEKMVKSFRYVMGLFIEAKWSKLMPFQKRQLQQLINMDISNFFAFLEILRPARGRDWDWDLRHKAEKVKCPVLAILGEDDRMVPPNLIATRLRQYLLEANNQDYEVIVIPGANHILTRTGSGLYGEFIPGYLDKMTSWILAHSTNTSR
jgi:pimeloyl-ACP methyl ester carboxylesterase